MEYFKLKDDKQQDLFVNLSNVLWVSFNDERQTIIFNRCNNDAVSIAIPQHEYEQTKDKLVRVLDSSTSVVLD